MFYQRSTIVKGLLCQLSRITTMGTFAQFSIVFRWQRWLYLTVLLSILIQESMPLMCTHPQLHIVIWSL